MKILISNYDGIYARGINKLIEILAPHHDVYVVAPEYEQSATAHALTLHKPIRIKEVEMNHGVRQAFSVSGTPSDCVKIALNALITDRMDVIISGINHGPNLGSDVLYSGTVSAALEGAINGLPGIAVSLVNGAEKMADFTHGAEFILDFLPKAMEAGIPPKSILNVNIPAVSLQHYTGIQISELGTRMYTDTYERRVDPRGGIYYWLAGEAVEEGEAASSDVMAILNNMVSVTPIHYDLTDYPTLKRLRSQFNGTTEP